MWPTLPTASPLMIAGMSTTKSTTPLMKFVTPIDDGSKSKLMGEKQNPTLTSTFEAPLAVTGGIGGSTQPPMPKPPSNMGTGA